MEIKEQDKGEFGERTYFSEQIGDEMENMSLLLPCTMHYSMCQISVPRDVMFVQTRMMLPTDYLSQSF